MGADTMGNVEGVLLSFEFSDEAGLPSKAPPAALLHVAGSSNAANMDLEGGAAKRPRTETQDFPTKSAVFAAVLPRESEPRVQVSDSIAMQLELGTLLPL